jgi:hypothetical protein
MSSYSANADIIGSFPNPTIEAISGLPTYDSINAIHLKLNQNAASVDSNLGDGLNGLLPLTVSMAVYNTISNTPFVAPNNPGPHPIVVAGSTAAQLVEANRIHKEDTRIWREFQATDKSLKQLLLGAVSDIYTSPLKNRVTGYANITTRQLIIHLYDKYGNITAGALDENEQQMKAPIDPNQPIENLFTQMEKAVDFADAAGTPFSANQIVTTAYNLVFKTGLYNETCRDWRRRAAVDKTWTNFQSDFSAAAQDLRESQATSQTAGYHSANAAVEEQNLWRQETVDALANLATATASDRSTLAGLTTALAAANAEIATLKQQLTERPAASQNASHQQQRFKHGNYCWTHGFRCGRNHTSATCKWPGEGHRKDATKDNKQGGSEAK